MADSGRSAGKALRGRRIALPETRELDRLSQMLEAEGAETLRCPMVAIVDPADPAPVQDWLRRFVARPPEDLILLTGEGLRRLCGIARGIGLEAEFVAALGPLRKVTRGPKPGQALREIALKPDLRAPEPTTEGVIAALAAQDLVGHRVGVQLYPGNPNARLLDFLRDSGATPDPVLPYAYASAAEDGKVMALIDEMAEGRVDAIAFTSSPQIRRLFDLAKAQNREARLRTALERTAVAAIGPVAAAELRGHGITVAITPEHRYFMKPLVGALAAALSRPRHDRKAP
jgi:uroporphyrinogen-III synthase